jgi:hypothetical protein
MKERNMSDEQKVLCFLDVLGFESLFKSIGLRKIEDRYEKLIEYVKEQTGGIDIVPTPGGRVAVGWLVLGNAYFSDTIIFWTNYSKMSLPSFTHLISETICYGIEHRLPLRGTISVGDAVLDKDSGKYLGEPIIEAARTERLQKWIGVSFGSSFANPGYNEGFHLNTVLPYKSHYKKEALENKEKSKYCTGMVVDWPRRWRESRKTDVGPLISALDTKPEFFDYYERTLRFIEFSQKNHDWFIKDKHLNYG